MLFNTRTQETKVVHQFDLEKRGGTGLIGVTLDPDFSSNRYIYLYYSPPAKEEPFLFNLSRFTLRSDNSLDLTSEKILLQVPVQANSGAHHGGSLAWDKEGNLYLSTGDSSSPFPSNGYPPLDERPGAEFYALDAQRGSSNTNDLKGKILKIHPEADGTYTIPEDNLFKPGTAKTRPEIYAMGCRNPYRIAVHPGTGTVYWGDIGPDAGKDSVQGPRGYDEFNQARQAGNFGWPYFIGNNKAYAEWDFETNKALGLYDPAKPINNSPNNTGLTELPPAQPAMIWYPYSPSEEFPELGQGGRSAMAGEFYFYDEDSPGEKKFPEYYDGSLFVFDWMRNWVINLRFDEHEKYLRSEPFMATLGDFRRPIDLTFGKDGVMYMLEYGSVYGADNEDARLVKIEYNGGNRFPVANASIKDSAAWALLEKRVFLTSELKLPQVKTSISGSLPLKVSFSSAGSNDPDDNDRLSYLWSFEKNKTSDEANPSYTFRSPGIHTVVLNVTDKQGLTSTDTVFVTAGNEAPIISLKTGANTSFYSGKKTFVYEWVVEDKEDGTISGADVAVEFEYQAIPKSSGSAIPLGLSLMNDSDCKACHTQNKKSVGPSYVDIAKRYKDDDAAEKLARKVISGGGGSWGTDHVMSAHPQLDIDEATAMVNYILSLADQTKGKVSISTKGSLKFDQHKPDEPLGRYVLTASYTDHGAPSVRPIQSKETITLRNPTQLTIYADSYSGFGRFGNSLTSGDHKSYYLFRSIDLNKISGFIYDYSAENRDGEIEVRMDSYAGPIISTVHFEPTEKDKPGKLTAKFSQPQSGRHDLYFILVKRTPPHDEIANVKSITFEIAE
jgi:cytochrome c